ncbi:methyltransferase domain-containing protein [Gordonia prachuapensis]|uniref:methyltransferase domain-containing protein n=1 Tax=Gordonia prachuapensis TaxID=3115651 RepID=UPI003D67D328
MRCPACFVDPSSAAELVVTDDGRSLVCASSHRFDVARQGYVSLLDGRATPHRSDTAAMVAARRRVHESGFFDPVARIVADGVASATVPSPGRSDITTGRPDLVLDAGAGTGHYLSATLAEADELNGIGLDLSKYCARAVARSHPRAAAVVADVWRPLPIRSGAIGAVLSVFSPRNLAEFARVLHPDGVLVVVTPDDDHLAEIIGPMGMLSVADDKAQRLRSSLGGLFEITAERSARYRHDADATLLADLVAMGPSAFHLSDDEIGRAARAMTRTTGHVPVTVSVTAAICRPRIGAEVTEG